MRQYSILNLGAGVQSTTLYLMFHHGELPPIDYAIFADTGDEPVAVYEHIEWLKLLNGPEILVRTKGQLSDDLSHGVNSTGQRFASIPAYTKAAGDEREGRLRRQCSREYKIDVIERTIRREIVGLKPRQRFPKNTYVVQYYGISLDEGRRARSISERCRREVKWSEPRFPLIDKMWTRANCLTYLADKVPHIVPRSACVFCPFHSDLEWAQLKAANGADWKHAVQVDALLREPGRIVNRNMDKSLYVHRQCVPLDEVALKPKINPREMQLGMGFVGECEGVCGV